MEVLKAVRKAYKNYLLVSEKTDRYKQDIAYAKTTKLSDLPKSELSGNSTESRIINALAYDEEVQAAFDEYIRQRHAAEQLINSLPDNCIAEKELLTRKYIFFESWKSIQVNMRYSKRYIFKIHKSALEKLDTK